MAFKGLFQLETPRDLLQKLRHDFSRLRAVPNDAYTAFDFFVTAEHMLDWVHPGAAGRPMRTHERNNHVILQVISHLATGAKHMIPEAPHHQSVSHADAALLPYGDQSYGSGTFGGVTLVIELDGVSATVLGGVISPLQLAERVMEYWEAHPAFA